LVALLGATASARRLLSFPALSDVQRLICDTLYVAAAAAVGVHDDEDSKFWVVNSVLADLFTGGCFGGAGDL
jgi:hypothetical protein